MAILAIKSGTTGEKAALVRMNDELFKGVIEVQDEDFGQLGAITRRYNAEH